MGNSVVLDNLTLLVWSMSNKMPITLNRRDGFVSGVVGSFVTEDGSGHNFEVTLIINNKPVKFLADMAKPNAVSRIVWESIT